MWLVTIVVHVKEKSIRTIENIMSDINRSTDKKKDLKTLHRLDDTLLYYIEEKKAVKHVCKINFKHI